MIYENVKKLANEQGMSIAALEKKAGIGNGVISGWKNSSPNVASVQAVAKVLKVKVSKLIE